MSTLELHANSGSTKVVFADSWEFLMSLKNGPRMTIVTDENVMKTYNDKMDGFDTVVLEAGENSKTLESAERIYDKFLEYDVDRSSLIVGIGGGTVTDATGFVAATFMRGVPFGFVPTTLLAQVDASIGGKNGLNFRGFKNMIGTVKQPEFCVVDFSFLKTLPSDQMISGMAEVAKCGVIMNRRLFEHVERNHARIISLETQSLETAVSEAISSKISVVEMDERDGGERMKLNFGHTVGHAIEKVMGLPHGKSVAIGMAAESRLASYMGLLPITDVDRIERLLERLGLPTGCRANGSEVFEAIGKDKKSSGEFIRIALPETIGRGSIHKIDKEELRYAVDEVCS